MKKKSIISCIDAGSENCPCFLALTGNCLTCSRLQNKDICDCAWTGACIYNEFILAGKRVNNPRGEVNVPIVKKITYADGMIVYILDAGKGFAIKSGVLGSYIFMKNESDSSFYEAPISILRTNPEKGWIYVAFKVISAKTKRLAQAEESLVIRGPYRNGLIGVREFEKAKGKTLLICRGAGISPAVFAAEHLGGQDETHLIVDTENTNAELALDYLQDLPVTVKYRKLSDTADEQAVKKQMAEGAYQKVGIFASDYFVSKYGKMARETISDAALAVSNNFNICCGEGICGACTLTNDRGETIKMCKCQTAAEEIFRSYKEKDSINTAPSDEKKEVVHHV